MRSSARKRESATQPQTQQAILALFETLRFLLDKGQTNLPAIPGDSEDEMATWDVVVQERESNE
jgi:hypothetical protein